MAASGSNESENLILKSLNINVDNLFRGPIIHKVPGEAPPVRDKATHLGDLSKLSKVQLQELLARQNKLLENKNPVVTSKLELDIPEASYGCLKSFISTLPDKGLKLHSLRERILTALSASDDLERTLSKFTHLSLSSQEVVGLEWKRREEGGLDSDDDSEEEGVDPLKIMATGNCTQRIVRFEKAARSDIYEVPDSFLPYKSLVKHSPIPKPREPIIKSPSIGERRDELTAATPPRYVHNTTSKVTIEESIRLQEDQHKKLKTLQVQTATDHLRVGVPDIRMRDYIPDPSGKMLYRDTTKEIESDESDGGEVEGYDEEEYDQEDRIGTVSYTVTS